MLIVAVIFLFKLLAAAGETITFTVTFYKDAACSVPEGESGQPPMEFLYDTSNYNCFQFKASSHAGVPVGAVKIEGEASGTTLRHYDTMDCSGAYGSWDTMLQALKTPHADAGSFFDQQACTPFPGITTQYAKIDKCIPQEYYPAQSATRTCGDSGAPTPAPVNSVNSCPSYCLSQGTTGGAIIGTAPFCAGACGTDCPTSTCDVAPESWTDHGASCSVTGQKVCCCASGLISSSSKMGCWYPIFIVLWTLLRSYGQMV